MITKNRAREQMDAFQKNPPVNTMAEINEIIHILSSLGQSTVSIFIPEKKLESFKKSLRKRGFDVQYIVFESLLDEIHLTINWDISDFNASEKGVKINE